MILAIEAVFVSEIYLIIEINNNLCGGDAAAPSSSSSVLFHQATCRGGAGWTRGSCAPPSRTSSERGPGFPHSLLLRPPSQFLLLPWSRPTRLALTSKISKINFYFGKYFERFSPFCSQNIQPSWPLCHHKDGQ